MSVTCLSKSYLRVAPLLLCEIIIYHFKGILYVLCVSHEQRTNCGELFLILPPQARELENQVMWKMFKENYCQKKSI